MKAKKIAISAMKDGEEYVALMGWVVEEMIPTWMRCMSRVLPEATFEIQSDEMFIIIGESKVYENEQATIAQLNIHKSLVNVLQFLKTLPIEEIYDAMDDVINVSQITIKTMEAQYNTSVTKVNDE